MSANLMPEPGDWFVTTISGPGGFGVGIGEAWADSVTLHKLTPEERALAQHWRHAGVFLEGGRVLQAEPHGAEIVEWEPAPGTLISTGVPELALPASTRAKVETLAAEYKGTPYSWTDYLQIAAHRMGLDTSRLQAEIKTSGHMMCSQLVDRFQLALGVHLFNDDRWEGDVMPIDLGLLLKSLGAVSWV